MTIDKQKLKALAEAATQGKWVAERDDLFFYEDGYTKHLMETSEGSDICHDAEHPANLSFIAAASPATVLAMLAEIERRDENPNFRAVQSARQEAERLKAENEALRKDAENWKKVQRAMEQLKSDEQGAAIWSACSRILISLASDLNSARSVVTEEGVTKDGAEIGDWRVTVERVDMAKEANHG